MRVTATAVNPLRECVRSLGSVDAVQYIYTSHTRDTSAAAASVAVCARTRKLQTVRPGVLSWTVYSDYTGPDLLCSTVFHI